MQPPATAKSPTLTLATGWINRSAYSHTWLLDPDAERASSHRISVTPNLRWLIRTPAACATDCPEQFVRYAVSDFCPKADCEVDMAGSDLRDHKAVVRRYVDEYQTGGREAVAAELVAADFIHHSGPAWTRTSTGREWAMNIVTVLHVAFPDIEFVIHDQIAEGDMVATRKTFRGTHLGDFMGIPATGKPVIVDSIDILRIANGQLAEHWTVLDMLGLMQQLGASPSPGRPSN
jgi:steroid delta-isomerase-like uncharacterized protein